MRFYEPKTLGKLNHTTYINENKKALLQYFGHCPWGQPFFFIFHHNGLRNQNPNCPSSSEGQKWLECQISGIDS